MQPQNKGPGMLWGQSYVLPMTWGGGGGIGAPFWKTCSPTAVSFLNDVSSFLQQVVQVGWEDVHIIPTQSVKFVNTHILK